MENQTFLRTLKTCGARLLLVVGVLGSLISIIGWSLDNRSLVIGFYDFIWNGLLYSSSFGGHFWATIFVSYLMVSVVLLACCVYVKLPQVERASKLPALILVSVVAVVLWFLAFCSMMRFVESPEPMSGAEGICAAINWIPLIALSGGIFYGIGIFLFAVTGAYEIRNEDSHRRLRNR